MMQQNHFGFKYIATMLLASRIPLRDLHRGHRLKQRRVNGVGFAVVKILRFILNLCNMQKGWYHTIHTMTGIEFTTLIHQTTYLGSQTKIFRFQQPDLLTKIKYFAT